MRQNSIPPASFITATASDSSIVHSAANLNDNDEAATVTHTKRKPSDGDEGGRGGERVGRGVKDGGGGRGGRGVMGGRNAGGGQLALTNGEDDWSSSSSQMDDQTMLALLNGESSLMNVLIKKTE